MNTCGNPQQMGDLFLIQQESYDKNISSYN